MKKLQTIIILIAVLLIGINPSTQGQSKHKSTPDASAAAPANDAKPITATCTAGITSPQNPDYSIRIDGKQNTVYITTTEPARKATETLTALPPDKNIVEINGEGNSVTISQETIGKVALKQSGKNNQVNISQKPTKPKEGGNFNSLYKNYNYLIIN